MSIKQRINDLLGKLHRGGKTNRDKTDSEISVEEVTRETIFPEGKKVKANQKAVAGKAEPKPTHKRGGSRPTNRAYQMIDPDDNTSDSSKS